MTDRQAMVTQTWKYGIFPSPPKWRESFISRKTTNNISGQNSSFQWQRFGKLVSATVSLIIAQQLKDVSDEIGDINEVFHIV